MRVGSAAVGALFCGSAATPSVCLGGMKERKGGTLSQSGGASSARRRAWAVCRPIGRRRQSAFDRQRHEGSPVPGSMAICALLAETGSEGFLVGFEAPLEVGARRASQAGRPQSIKKSRRAGFFYAIYFIRPLSQRQIGGPREWKPWAFFFLFGAPSGAPTQTRARSRPNPTNRKSIEEHGLRRIVSDMRQNRALRQDFGLAHEGEIQSRHFGIIGRLEVLRA